MDDDLERYRKLIEEERRATEEARARREAEKQREKAYESAWAAVFALLHQLGSDPNLPVDLEPLQQLAGELRAWERIQWLVEMADNFRYQLDRGWDTPDRTRVPEL